jgi:hypothetical protein
LMATSAAAASHCIALQRAMHLGVTTYTSHTRESLASLPFGGDQLFGGDLQSALQAEISLAQQVKQQDSLIMERPAKPAAKRPTAPFRAQPRAATGPPNPQASKASSGQGPPPHKKPKHAKKPKPPSKGKGPKV